MKFKMKNKLVSVALTATTLMWAVGVAALPVANADTASTQAQIQALLAQIAQLQAQMGTSSTTTGTTTSAYSFAKDLTLGSKGADVTALQQLLISKGDLTVVSAPTGYFGAATQAALAKFQTANGITPAAGYFGPKTRAFVNSMNVSTTTTTTTTTGSLPAGCTTASGYSPTTGASCSTTTTTTTTGTQTTTSVPAPASGIAVSVAASNPAAGSLISTQSGTTSGHGAARVPVLTVNFTAGLASGITVSSVNFHKLGVLSDSSVSGAYLTQNGKVLYQYNSLNQGVLNFSGMSLAIPAGQTVTLTLAIDVSGGLSAGNTTQFSLNSASDVTAYDANNTALTPSGMFPVTGNIFTVTNVSNPALASVDINYSSVGNQVTAGTQNNLVAAWTFNPQNSKVYLEGLNFHVIGSANKGDIRNVKLMINGTQVGQTLATVNQDGTAYFDTSATPGVLNTGSNNVQVFADVMGSPSYNFQFEILNGYDVNAVDSQYNVPVATYSDGVGMNGTTPVTIQQGQITTTQDVNTPTGNIAKGQSSITLAKFDVYAAGEAVKIQYLPFSLSFGSVSSTQSLLNEVQNISIVDDAGGQVGTTINQPPSGNLIAPASGNSCSPITSPLGGSNATSGTALANLTYCDSFGTAGSPINYTIPANTTRVLSLRADIESGASFSTITGNLIAPTGSNLQGMISSKPGTTSGANGSALTLAQSSLVVSPNSALGVQNVAAGVSGLRIGSYSFAASSAEGVNVNNVSVTLSPNGSAASNSTPSNVFQNLKLMINGVQFGTTYGTLQQNGQYTFSGTPFNVPAGSSANVDVYADILSSATSTYSNQYTPSTQLSGFTGTGMVSNSAISLTGGVVPGQALSIAGNSKISVAADSSQPSSGTLTMGSTGNTLAVYRFQETSNVENVKVTDLKITNTASVTNLSATGTLPSFSNLTMWNGSTLLGSVQSAAGTPATGSPTSTYTYQFHFTNPIIVPESGTVLVTLKGDIGTYTNKSATDNSQNTFAIAAAGDITALGQTSNLPSTPSLLGATVTSNTQTVLRSTMTVTASSIAQTGGKLPLNQIGTITLTANNAGSVALRNLNLTFSGNGLSYATSSATSSSGNLFLDSVKLENSNSVDVKTANNATSSFAVNGTPVVIGSNNAATGANQILWTFPTSTTPLVISAGQSITLELWGATNVIPGVGNVSQSLSASIQATSDATYLDGTDSAGLTGTPVSQPTNLVPITVTALSWGTGQ